MDGNLSEENTTVVTPDINQSVPDNNITVESSTTISTDNNVSEVNETLINKENNLSETLPDAPLSKEVNTTASTLQEANSSL